ncbi:MAG TPA: indole-3-glycerol phosphate synthase TrpC [Actinomycetota bacterium]|jgi:indole-3-glycerol phosphate synthase|nr:indole-3-glycerol phosphate synthase TrpC [Actinomycetota bacterium]
MSSFLDRIVASRRRAVDEYRTHIDELEETARNAPAGRGFESALRANGMSLIAEIKRRSPSKGDLKPDLDPAELARAYERAGARAISVLTESDFFGGSEDDLKRAREATSLPVLWKDFVLDRSQIVAACASGADAVLLIVRILGSELPALIDEAKRWSLCPLVEIFDERDLHAAVEAGADVVGVNHRDLETFDEDPTATTRLRPLVPDGIVVVAESAISTRADVEALEQIGVDAVLVGEAFVTAPDLEAKVKELLGA